MGQKLALSFLIVFIYQVTVFSIFPKEEHKHTNCLCQITKSLCHHPHGEKKAELSLKNAFFCKCPTKISYKFDPTPLFFTEKSQIVVIRKIERDFVLNVFLYQEPNLAKHHPPS